MGNFMFMGYDVKCHEMIFRTHNRDDYVLGLVSLTRDGMEWQQQNWWALTGVVINRNHSFLLFFLQLFLFICGGV